MVRNGTLFVLILLSQFVPTLLFMLLFRQVKLTDLTIMQFSLYIIFASGIMIWVNRKQLERETYWQHVKESLVNLMGELSQNVRDVIEEDSKDEDMQARLGDLETTVVSLKDMIKKAS